MHEPREAAAPPRDWHEAFARLPLETPPATTWNQLQARMQPARRRTAPRWWGAAAAAAVVLAVALPAVRDIASVPDAAPEASSAGVAASPAQDPLAPLYAESERLEALLRLVRDERVANGTATAVAADLDARIAAIDAELVQPGLPPERQLALWTARVQTLRAAAGLEGTRRWLAAHGTRYDAALVRID